MRAAKRAAARSSRRIAPNGMPPGCSVRAQTRAACGWQERGLTSRELRRSDRPPHAVIGYASQTNRGAKAEMERAQGTNPLSPLLRFLWAPLALRAGARR